MKYDKGSYFQLLPYGEKYPCSVGKRPENAAKNRFKTTFPCNTTLLMYFLSLNMLRFVLITMPIYFDFIIMPFVS